jgi:TPR repeat protein
MTSSSGNWQSKEASKVFPGGDECRPGCGLMGLGRPRTKKDAAKCFMSAASKGHPFAAYMLAGCYSDGNGVPQDYALGTQWLEKSANLGLAKSQHDVGHLYARNALNTQWLASRPANPTDPKVKPRFMVTFFGPDGVNNSHSYRFTTIFPHRASSTCTAKCLFVELLTCGIAYLWTWTSLLLYLLRPVQNCQYSEWRFAW